MAGGRDEREGSRPSRPQRRRARKLVEEALAARAPIRRMELARKAIEEDDSVADAWGILAEEEPEPATSATLFAKALERAEAALGSEGRSAVSGSTETVGQPAASIFWEDEAAESYVRSRTGLGLALSQLEGREEEAATHMLGVLQLDPLDRMDLSHHAIPLLMGLGTEESDTEARRLMEKHPCDCAHHCYWDALLSFRQYGGDDERTILALAGAIGSGPVVPPFLFGEYTVPRDVPSLQELQMIGGMRGEEHAAVLSASLASELLPLWKKTPGARQWLKSKWQMLGRGSASLLEDPASAAGMLAGGRNPDSVLAAMLGAEAPTEDTEDADAATPVPGTPVPGTPVPEPVQPGWEEREAGFMFWREREEEDVALSRFRDGLEDLIEDRAEKAGLMLKRGSAPFPGSLDVLQRMAEHSDSPFAGLPEASPLSYLAATGEAGRVADLAEALLEERVWDFSVFAEDPEVVEAFYRMGAEVFEGPVGEIPGE